MPSRYYQDRLTQLQEQVWHFRLVPYFFLFSPIISDYFREGGLHGNNQRGKRPHDRDETIHRIH